MDRMCTGMYSIILLSRGGVDFQHFAVLYYCQHHSGKKINEILFQKVKIQKITKGEVERKKVLVQAKARDVKEKAD